MTPSASMSFAAVALSVLVMQAAAAETHDPCVNVAYEGEIEKVNGLAATTYTLPRLNFHVIFHDDGTTSWTESALLKSNDIVGERTAIGNWEATGDHSIEFTLFQSVVDQSNVLFTGCGNYACKNTILASVEFAPDCSSFTYKWTHTILGEDGEPAPSPLYAPGKNYLFTEGSGVTSSMDDVRALFDRLGIPRP